MVSKIVAVAALLSSCLVFVQAAAPKASKEELALRAAITSKTISSYVLKKNITLTSNLPRLPDNKVLTVRSAGVKGAPFAIDGASKYYMFIDAGDDSRVNLTISNVILTRSPACILITSVVKNIDWWSPRTSDVTIDRVNFLSNVRAMHVEFTNVKVSNSLFSRGSSSAIVLDGHQFFADYVATITNCTFTGNKATYNGGGGIKAYMYGSINITKCKFVGNKATPSGGAVSVHASYAYGYDTKVVIRDSEFISNVATNDGKPVYGGGALSSRNDKLHVYNSTFKGNNAPCGGAVYISEYATFQDTKFIDNKATSFAGGALLVDGLSRQSDINFCSCTFSKNVGVKKPNNIHVLGYNGSGAYIGTNPFVAIPYVTKKASTFLKIVNGSCVEE